MVTYNGYKNWNQWNVSLWINNDEGLYRQAVRCIRRTDNRQEAAEALLDELHEMNVTKTPDGAPYSVTTIRAAMVGM